MKTFFFLYFSLLVGLSFLNELSKKVEDGLTVGAVSISIASRILQDSDSNKCLNLALPEMIVSRSATILFWKNGRGKTD